MRKALYTVLVLGLSVGLFASVTMIKDTTKVGIVPGTVLAVSEGTGTTFINRGSGSAVQARGGAVYVAGAGGYPSSNMILFNGSTDFLVSTDNTAYNVGTGDFSFSCDIYPLTYLPSTAWGIAGCPANGTGASFAILQVVANTTFWWYLYANDVNKYKRWVDGNIPVNTWYHIEWIRKNGILYFFKNGVSLPIQAAGEAGAPDTLSYNFVNFYIGRAGLGNDWYANGYIANPRLVKGNCTYEAPTPNFTYTPPNRFN